MAETETKTATCPACGADARAGSLFCYNCGGKISTDGNTPDDGANVRAAEDDKHRLVPAPGLRPAPSLKRRRSSFEKAPRKVAWVPDEERSDSQFIVVTVLVFIFSLIVTALAFYLR